jgi:hypothetical protein
MWVTMYSISIKDSSSSYWALAIDTPDDVLQPCRLIVLAQLWKSPLAPPGILTPTTTRRPLKGKGGTAGEKWPVILLTNGKFHAICRDLLHAANLRHGTDGFISPLKEGMLRIFLLWKMWQLWLGSNPQTCVPEARMLPLDHRSHSIKDYKWITMNFQHLSIFFATYWGGWINGSTYGLLVVQMVYSFTIWLWLQLWTSFPNRVIISLSMWLAQKFLF